jgi:hypothetical protein
MELIEHAYTSDFTKKTLQQFGWKDGDAIPADLGSLMLSMKETLPASKKTDVLVDRELMSEEQVASIETMLREAAQYAKKKKQNEEIEEKSAAMSPSVAEAYRKIAEEQPAPEIIDDRAAPAAEPAPPAEPAETQVIAVPAEEPKPAAVFCPRCGWDARMKFDIVPTNRDKEDFLSTLLGGQRFRKKYELFGGKVVVTFRSVLAEENKLIYRQLVLDQAVDKVRTEAEWFVQLMDYRLACALDTITNDSGKVLAEMPELVMPTGPIDADGQTPVVAQLDIINKNILAQEATRRLVGTHLRQFQRLIEGLEAMALEPSFWTGIE